MADKIVDIDIVAKIKEESHIINTLNQINTLIDKIKNANSREIKLQLSGNVLKDLISIDKEIKRITANKVELNLNINNKIRELNKLIEELKKAQSEYNALTKKDSVSFKELDKVQSDLHNITNKVVKARNELKTYREEYSMLSRGEDALKKLQNEYKTLDKDILNIQKDQKKLSDQKIIDNSALEQTISRLTRVSETLKLIGNTGRAVSLTINAIGRGLTQFASFYGGGILNNPLSTITNTITSKAKSSISGGITRYDTLKTFPQYMKTLGVSETQSKKYLNEMWESVTGTELKYDEMAKSAKQYALTLGNDRKGVDLAISSRLAYLYGGADIDGSAYSNLEYLITSGDFKTNKQWNTLVTSLGNVGPILAKTLGVNGTRELIDKLYSDEITGDMFLDALSKLKDNKELLALKDVYQSQISSIVRTLNNSLNVGMAGVLETLDGILGTKGSSIRQELDGLLTGTKGIFTQLTKWLEKNPDKIFKFLDKIKNYDWSGLITKVGKNVSIYAKMVTGIFTKVPTGVSAFGMTLAGPLGRVFSQIGMAGVMGSRGISSVGQAIGGRANLKKLDLKDLKQSLKGTSGVGGISGLASGVDEVSQTTTKLGGLKTKLSTSLGLTAGIIGVLGEAVLVMWGIGKALESISNMKFGKSLGRNMGIITITGGVLLGIVGTLVGIFTALSSSGVGALAIAVGELATLGIVGIVALAVKTMKDMAEATEIISNLKISKNITSNLDAVGTVLSELSKTMVKIAKDNYIGFWDSIKYKNLSKAFLNMGEALQSIINVSANLDKIMDNPHLSNIYAKRAVKEQLVETIQLYGDILKEIEPYLTVKEQSMNNRYQKVTNIRSLPLNAMLNTLTDVSDIFVQMQSAITNLKGIDTSTDELNIKDFEKAITKITDCINILNENLVLSGKWASLDMANNESLKNINVMIATLSGISSNINTMSNHTYNLENLFTTLDGILNDINKIDNEKLGTAKGKVNDLAKSVNDLQQVLNNFTWQPFIDNLLGGALLSTLDLVQSKIRSLQSDILLLNGSKSNIVSANFVGPLQPNFVRRAEGGIIGKVANGVRSIFASGSDTIHTLLTPGEFVVRKSASSSIGYSILDKINNLDFAGAYAELSTRMGFNLQRARVGATTNNYNNNAKIIINNNNGGSDYTFNKASRAVKKIGRYK